MRIVPFFANSPDNNHCVPMVIRMILNYFTPKNNFSLSDIEKVTGYNEKYWTWPFQTWQSLTNLGFEIVVFDSFDYQRFSKEGGKYLIEFYGKEEGETQIKYSNIKSAQKLAKTTINKIKQIKKYPTITEINKYLKQGYLVKCSVNSKIFSNSKGYMGHSVLVFDIDNKYVYLHDPGLPPRKNLKMLKNKFIKAWAYPTKEAAWFEAFRLNKKKFSI